MLELPYILLLAPFTLWWYVFTVVVLGLAFWAMDNEDTIGGIIWLTVLFCVGNVVLGAGATAFGWVVDNPLYLLGGAAGYLAVGVGWCVFRWYSLVRRARELYKKLAAEWAEQDLKSDVRHYVDTRWTYRRDRRVKSFRPQCSQHKARITNWIAYWPLSVIWIGIREWVVDFLNMIYEAISGVLERISLNTWDGVDD